MITATVHDSDAADGFVYGGRRLMEAIMVEQSGLARIILIAPHRRVEIAVPEHVPLAGVLPTLLRHAGSTLAEDGVDHGGWTLRRIDGGPLDAARSLAMQNVLDGETLVLAPRNQQWPEPAFDDVAEAIADGAARYGARWSPQWTVRIGRVLAVVALLAGALAPLRTPDAAGGGIALAVAAALLAATVAFDRILHDASATGLAGAYALIYAAVGADMLGAADGSLLDPWPLTGAAAAVVFVAVTGRALAPAAGGVFVGGAAFAAVLGVVTALGASMAISPAQAAATAGGAAALLLFALPRWAMTIGGIPAPSVPTLDGETEDPAPPAVGLAVATRRSDDLLTGLLAGMSGALAACLILILLHPSSGGVLLALAITAVCGLRARAFAAVRHRASLIAVAAAGTTALAALTYVGLPASPGAAAVAIAIALLAAYTAVAAGRRLARGAPSPQLGRVADWLTFLATAAIPILVALVLGAFGFMRGLGG